MNAQELLDFLLELSKRADLSKVKLNYRHDYDSDVEEVTSVAEHQYDEETNNVLTDIVFVTYDSDEEPID